MGEQTRIGNHLVYGVSVDPQTRCSHYHGPLDVLAILFPCCRRWYPCHLCHAETADHEATRWPSSDVNADALLCGVCGGTSTIAEYTGSGICARCGAGFNPGCALHHHLYFE